MNKTNGVKTAEGFATASERRPSDAHRRVVNVLIGEMCGELQSGPVYMMALPSSI